MQMQSTATMENDIATTTGHSFPTLLAAWDGIGNPPPHHPCLLLHRLHIMPPHIQLIYFNFGGRAESIRLTLHVGGVAFDDVRITEEEFRSSKAEGKYPFGSVPVLIVDDVTYAQSVGILRYVGRLGGMYLGERSGICLRCQSLDDYLAPLHQLIICIYLHTSHRAISRRSTRWASNRSSGRRCGGYDCCHCPLFVCKRSGKGK